MPDDAGTVLSKLENYVLVPALVISNFMTNCNIENLSANYMNIVYSAVLVTIAMLIAIPLSKPFSKEKPESGIDCDYQRSIYKYALTFGNFGFMGNAVVLGVLGDAGLFKYLLFTMPLNVLVYTWGMYILIPKGKRTGSVLKNLMNPIFISLLLGMVLGLLNAKDFMPEFFVETVSSAKACMGPVAMILTGFIVGGYDFKKLLTKKRIYLATFLRLFVIPGMMLLLLKYIGAGKEIMTMALFAFAAPLGLNTIVFPAAYGGDTKTGASMAMISHTLSVVTLPIMYLVFIEFLMR